MSSEKLLNRSAPRREAGASLGEWLEKLRAQTKRVIRGVRGEKIVGAVLDELQNEEYQAVHAIRGNGYDIDHVLVGPGGVFVIETKHPRGSGRITFRNGHGLFVGKRRRWRWDKAITQAKSGAGEVARVIERCSECSLWVRPFVVFAGDWMVDDRWKSTDVRVFTPDSLKSYIRDQQPIVKRDEIESIASHLERSAKT